MAASAELFEPAPELIATPEPEAVEATKPKTRGRKPKLAVGAVPDMVPLEAVALEPVATEIKVPETPAAEATAPESTEAPKPRTRGRKTAGLSLVEAAPIEVTLVETPPLEESITEIAAPETETAASATAQPKARRGRKAVVAPEPVPEPVKPRARGRKVSPEVVSAEPESAGLESAGLESIKLELVAPESVESTAVKPDELLGPSGETLPPLEGETVPAVAPKRLVRVRKTARENVFETQAKLTNPLEMLLEYLRANPGGHALRDLEKDLEDGLLKRLGGRKGLEEALDELLRLGALMQLKRHTYSLTREVNAVVGRLSVRPDGWGVVEPETPGLREMLIPPDCQLFAWSGDRVVARETKRNGEAHGKVIRVLERARGVLVGTLEYSRGALTLRPDEAGVPAIPVIPGEPGIAGESLRAGARVAVQPRYPEATGEDEAFGSVVTLLGETDSLETERRAVMVKFNLPGEFSAEALKEAQKVAGVATKDLLGRVDLRVKRVIASSVALGGPAEVGVQAEPLGNGNVLIGVHIVDAQYFVDEGKAVDREAQERGVTVDLTAVQLGAATQTAPQESISRETALRENVSRETVPLLPAALVKCAALEIGADRLAVSVLIEASPDGNVVNYIVRQSVVNAKANLDDGLVGAERELLERLTSGLRSARGGTASTLLEELLLLANRLVATTLAAAEAPALYRYTPPGNNDLETALERSGGASPAMLQGLRERLTRPAGLMATAFPKPEYALDLTRPLSRYSDLLNQRVLAFAITKLSVRRRESLEETLPVLAAKLAGLEENARQARHSLEQYLRREQIALGSQVKGIVTQIDPWGLKLTLENGSNARLSIQDMDEEYQYSDAPQSLKGRSGRVFKPGSIARVHVIGSGRWIRLSLGKENPMSKQKRPSGANPSSETPRRQVVVLHAKPRGEYQRSVRVTARKLYFGEWSRAQFVASDEFGGEIALERPQQDRAPNRSNPNGRSARGGNDRPPATRGPQAQNGRPQPHQARGGNAPKVNGAAQNQNSGGQNPNAAQAKASRIAELKRRAEQTLERNVARANRGPAEGSSVPAPGVPQPTETGTETAARSSRRRRRGGRGNKTPPTV